LHIIQISNQKKKSGRYILPPLK